MAEIKILRNSSNKEPLPKVKPGQQFILEPGHCIRILDAGVLVRNLENRPVQMSLETIRGKKQWNG